MSDEIKNSKTTNGRDSKAKAEKDARTKKEVEEIRTYLWWSATCAIAVGIIMIAILVYNYGSRNVRLSSNYFGAGVLIAGGSLLSGGFLGFIFGIPSILQLEKSRIKYNDNLVQISDWLTKIIVGVGLTQLYNIPHFIIQIGEHFQANFGGIPGKTDINAVSARNVSIAIIGYFIVLGFLMIYFWTKTDYSTIMKYMDDDFNAEVEVEKQAKEEAQQETLETTKKLETVKEESKAKEEDLQALSQTFSSVAKGIKEKREEIKNSPAIEDDPQKGKWGGSSEANGRKITATVRETSYDKNWFNVNIEVSSTDPRKPLTDNVVFHLHPSFPNEIQTAQPVNGIATVQIIAYGAFTVGVECDGGTTKLELDLAELPDAPQLFKER